MDGIQVSGNDKTSQELIFDLVDVPVGEEVDLHELDRVRRRLLRTGYFTDVTVELARGEERGHVVLDIDVEERNTILLSDVILGSSTDHDFWGGLDVVEGNLLGRGLSFQGAFVATNDQYGVRSSIADPHSFALPLRLSASGHHLDGTEKFFLRRTSPSADGTATFRRSGGEMGIGIYPLALLGVFLDVGYESIDVDSTRPDLTDSYVANGRSDAGYFRLTLDHDTRDDPWVPTSGYRMNLSLQSSADGIASDYSYLKAVLRSSYHQRLPFSTWLRHVLRFDMFGGIILGNAPWHERFFIGDVTALVPARDLTMNFSSRSSPDLLGRGADHLGYETVMAGGGIEYGVPLIEGGAPLYRVEFFVGAGVFGMTSPDDLPGRRAVSFGIEYGQTENPTSFPMGLTFDSGFRAETPIGIFGLSFANGLALVPF